MEDSAPVGRAIRTTDWKTSKNFNILPWLGTSPDINLIENVWHILQVNLLKRF